VVAAYKLLISSDTPWISSRRVAMGIHSFKGQIYGSQGLDTIRSWSMVDRKAYFHPIHRKIARPGK
jgi:hypothetical protein